MTAYAELKNLSVKSEDGLSFAYRDTGGDERAVVLFQHFRGNLDNWDPALVDDLLPNSEIHPLDAGHFAWEQAAGEYGRLVVDWVGGGYRRVAAG